MNIDGKIFVAGTRWVWEENPSNYPASSFRLVLTIRKSNSSPISFDSILYEGGFRFSINAVESAIAHGEYSYQIRAISLDDETEVYQIWRGVIDVLPDLAAEADPRGPWTKLYDALSSALSTWGGSNIVSVSVNGRSVTYADKGSLTRDMNHAKVKSEIEQGKRSGENQIYNARFR